MFKRGVLHSSESSFKIDHTLPTAKQDLANHLRCLIHEHAQGRPVAVVCIGTDRSTGDSLGPLVGSRLSTLTGSDSCYIFGDLEHPVHAVNLKETIDGLYKKLSNPFVVAIDACLGQLQSVGLVTIGMGPLKPGAGVNKELPEVGDVHITGIVNVGGFMEYFVLQNTRLSVVIRMAECMAQALAETFSETHTSPAKDSSAISLDARSRLKSWFATTPYV